MLRSELPAIQHFYQLVEEFAEDKNTQDNVAIYSDDENKITYKELNNRVNQLAYYLLDPKNGVHSAETRIGLFFHLSIEYIICMLAIMKAGLSFVPLSANTDVERLQEFVKLSQIQLMLSNANLNTHLFLTSNKNKIIYLETLQDTLNLYPTDNPHNQVNLDQLAYVHNTSGSTAKPKQVLINHAGLLNCATDLVTRLAITEQDKTAAYADISFDAHIAEMMMTLGAGAALYLVPSTTRLNYLSLTQYYKSHGITVSTLTPSVLNVLSPDAFPTLRVLLSTGEAVTKEIVTKWCVANPNLLFVNGYGPAEVTIATSIAILKPGDPIHIGSPIKGLKIYILAKETTEPAALKWVNPGERGEMYISGIGVGRGYSDENLTAERFVTIADPDDPDKKIRLYQTRDEAKYEITASDSLRFYVTGRLDRQVKIYGKLICPEEIEALLLNDNVTQAQVDPKKTPSGHPAFIAYLYVKEPFDLYEYYAKIVKKLPAATAPARWVISDIQLLNTSGKNSLKSSSQEPIRLHAHAEFKTMNTLQSELATLWKNVLEISEEIEFTLDDNFFMLGGTSLQTANLLVLLREKFELKLTLSEFAYIPTIGALARHIARLKNETNKINTPILLNAKDAILNTETPLFLIHSLLGDAELDYGKLINKWPSQRPIYGISSRSFKNIADMDNNLDAIANDYIAAMKSIQPRGPYLLGGWSAGGLIAYAMCQILKNQNEKVYLHMIDSEALAIYRQKNRKQFSAYLLDLFELKLSSMLNIPTTPIDKTLLATLPKTKQIYSLFAALLAAVEKTATEATKMSPALLTRKKALIATVKNTLLAILNYVESCKIDNAILWAATETQKKCGDERLSWLESEIDFSSIRKLDGNHESILLDPLSAKTLSSQLEKECTQQIEAEKQISIRYFNRPSINNNLLIGREKELNHLQKIFRKIGRNQDLAIIQHEDSVGKSQIAAQYFNQTNQEYELKLWFRADNTTALLEDYENFAKQFNLFVVGNNIKEAVKSFLEKRKNWLAVYNNAGPLKEIKSFMPSNGGHVIITSHYPEWCDIGLDIGINPLSTKNTVSLLQTITNQQQPEEITAQTTLAVEFNKIPLIICQLACYLNKTKRKPTDFLSQFKEKRQTILNTSAIPTFYQQNLAYAILMDEIISAINSDIKNDPNLKYSLVILQAIAHLHSDGGSYSILKVFLQQIDKSASTAKIELLLDKSIEHLSVYSLLQYDHNRRSLNIHHSTQEMLKQHHLSFSSMHQYIKNIIQGLYLARDYSDCTLSNLAFLAFNIQKFASQQFHPVTAEIHAALSETYTNKLETEQALINAKKALEISNTLADPLQIDFYRAHYDYIDIMASPTLIKLNDIIDQANNVDNVLKNLFPQSIEQEQFIRLKRINLILNMLAPALAAMQRYIESISYLNEVVNLIKQAQASTTDAKLIEKLHANLLQTELIKSDVNCKYNQPLPPNQYTVFQDLLKNLEPSSHYKIYLADIYHQTARLKFFEAANSNQSSILYADAWQALVTAFNLRFETRELSKIIPLLNDMAICCNYLNDTSTPIYLYTLAIVIYKKYFIKSTRSYDIGATYEGFANFSHATVEMQLFYQKIAIWYYSLTNYPLTNSMHKTFNLNTTLSADKIAKLTATHKKLILSELTSLEEVFTKKSLNLSGFGDELLEIASELSKLKWEEPGLSVANKPNTIFSEQQKAQIKLKNITPNLPWLPNSQFTGRTEFFNFINKSLPIISTEQNSIILTIYGMGGVGKSQLAVQYAYLTQQQKKYKLIWFLSAANLADGFLELSDAFNIPVTLAPAKRIATAKEYLQTNYGGKWLIIIDDAEDYESIKNAFISTTGGHFLITSRNAFTWPLKKELLIFDRNESLNLIDRVLTNNAEINSKDADDLAKLLGDLPLALMQACSYIQSSCSIKEYIDLYTTQRQELWTSEEAPNDYPVTVAVTFELNLKNIKAIANNHELDKFLSYCAYLHNDSIPKWLLKIIIPNSLFLSKIIKSLLKFSLIQSSEDRISIHKIVQQVMRDKFPDTSKKVILLLIEQSMTTDSTADLARNRELLEHYDTVLNFKPNSIDNVSLFFIAGLTHLRLGNPHKASTLFNSAITIKNSQETNNDREYAQILDYLGTAYGEINLPKLKKETLLKSLEIKLAWCEHHDNFTTDDLEFARTYNNLANAYGVEDNLLMQLHYLEKAYKNLVLNFGESHSESALVQANLGTVYSMLGEQAKARQHLEQALCILRKTYGNDHYYVGRLLNNLANHIGPMTWDVTLMRDYVVDIEVINAQVKCNVILCAEKQKELVEQAVAIQKLNYGKKNINVALIQSNLAKIYGALSLWSQQKAVLRSIAPIYEEFYGADNEQTLTIKEKLTAVEQNANVQSMILK